MLYTLKETCVGFFFKCVDFLRGLSNTWKYIIASTTLFTSQFSKHYVFSC